MSLQSGRIADAVCLPTEVCVTLIRTEIKPVCPACEKPANFRFVRLGTVYLHCDGCGRMLFSARNSGHASAFLTLHLVPTNARLECGDMLYYRDVPYEIDADRVVWKPKRAGQRKQSRDFYILLRKPAVAAPIS